MSSFSIPLSGLDATQQALNIISNNLANLNTVGYKGQTVSFRDLFYQTVGDSGSGSPIELGAGTAIDSVTTRFLGGSLDTTGVATDAAIVGDGFFVVQAPNGETQFTRAGNFSVNSSGQLVTQDGGLVQGFPAVNGVLTSVPGALTIGKGLTNPPSATTTGSITANLDASAQVGDTFSVPLNVFDSLGNSHVLSFDFTKSAANAWNYNVTVPAADVGGTGAPVSVANGALQFDSSGHLTSPAGNVAGINVGGLADGASAINVQWNLYDANNSPLLSQYADKSGASATQQNGYSNGTLQSFTINSDGTIQGVFSNGQTTALGQIALATFPDTEALDHAGDNSFVETLNSGAPVIGAPGTGARGSITGGALEMSTVDIAKEFSNMIITQRGFEANARVVTTFDQVTQDTINMKQP